MIQEEIVGYLPHNLKIWAEEKSMFSESMETEYERHVYTLSIQTLNYFIKHVKDKPILRPLSDLTKPITVDGKEFVPMEQFDSYNILMLKKMLDYKIHTFNLLYRVIVKLYKWHFDIHGLIEKGEAIDINTLGE